MAVPRTSKIRAVASTLGELFHFLWRRKLWWLAPLIIVLLMFVVLLVLGSAAGVGPLIYPLF